MAEGAHSEQSGSASTDQTLRPAPPVGPAIPPLNVSGLVVTKSDLITALRIYVPQLTDLAPLSDETFLLSLRPIAERQ